MVLSIKSGAPARKDWLERGSPSGEKIPVATRHRRYDLILRIGLVLGLVSAGFYATSSALWYCFTCLFSPITWYFISTPFYVPLLRLAGNITVCSTLPRRAAVITGVSIIAAYIALLFYNPAQFINLPVVIAVRLLNVFPYACMGIVLWHNGWLPKLIVVITCMYCISNIIIDSYNYLRFVIFVETFPNPPGWFWHGTEEVSNLFIFLWCILWGDLNARPTWYQVMQERSDKLKLPRSRSWQRRGWVILCLAVLWAIAWLSYSIRIMMAEYSIMVLYQGWSFQDALIETLHIGGVWWNAPLIVILLLVAADSFRQTKRQKQPGEAIKSYPPPHLTA